MISLHFFVILFISLILYWAIPIQRVRNWILILASYGYLYLTDKLSIVVVLGLTGFSYLFGSLIARGKRQGLYHILGVLGILAVLIVFKYLGFLCGTLNALLSFFKAFPRFNIESMILPLGISYIVFKHISFLTDIKWGLVSPGRLDDFMLYSSMFTIFVAGPIERYERFKTQVELNRISFSFSNVDFGILRITIGLFRKLVIADWIGYYINPVWQAPGGYALWIRILALLGYSIQIYMDFAGYSDIAIGSSRLFGLRIMENFQNPYLAPNISQFWRRWHISLSDWIRDYVFFPLSRLSKNNLWLKLLVPVVAMSLCGLWHGAAWHFILWGTWHGLGLAVFQLWSDQKRKHITLGKLSKKPGFTVLAGLLTFTFVTSGWVVFASAGFSKILHVLFNSSIASEIVLLPQKGMFCIAIGILFVCVLEPLYQNLIKRLSSRLRVAVNFGLFIVAVELMMNISAGQGSFIYAGF